jgi:RimJ/RimL family protein N-acetyltransferase
VADPLHLEGRFVRLSPLGLEHVDASLAAASEDRSTYGQTWVPADRPTTIAYVTKADAASEAGRQRHGRPDVVEIGATWLAASAQRTPVNTEAKLLMLTHAFETWEVHAVRFCTDRRNDRSRRAIERLGCTLDGILGAERPGPDGTIRDSAYFSLLAEEWPAAKQRLSDRLAAG